MSAGGYEACFLRAYSAKEVQDFDRSLNRDVDHVEYGHYYTTEEMVASCNIYLKAERTVKERSMTNDLISRQALCEYALNQKDKSITPNDIMRFPPAQPEIIRCKDCKFYTKMRWELDTGICSLASRHLGDDGFCSEAERRNDGSEQTV